MNERVAVRDLEQIQEDDDPTRMPRAATLAFVGLGATCLVFAAMALGGRTGAVPAPKVDPLGALASLQGARPSSSASASQLSSREVTFPGLLSDNASPTTALAAVVGANGKANASAPAGPLPPAPVDRLAVVPLPGPGRAVMASPVTGTVGNVGTSASALAAANIPPSPAAMPLAATALAAAPPSPPSVPLPAQNVLEATPIVTRPRDNVTREATAAAQLAQSGTPQAGPGQAGGYQLQVSSFHTQEEANGFAEQLRARGHKAYVAEAQVPGRGTWFRVRIGPFKDQHSAAAYRTSFETREHVVPFIVPPVTK